MGIIERYEILSLIVHSYCCEGNPYSLRLYNPVRGVSVLLSQALAVSFCASSMLIVLAVDYIRPQLEVKSLHRTIRCLTSILAIITL